jgi:Tol biopolymer transport system component
MKTKLRRSKIILFVKVSCNMYLVIILSLLCSIISTSTLRVKAQKTFPYAWKDDSSFGLENEHLLLHGVRKANIYDWWWDYLVFKDTGTKWWLPWGEFHFSFGRGAYHALKGGGWYEIKARCEPDKAYITYSVIDEFARSIRFDTVYTIYSEKSYIYAETKVTNLGSQSVTVSLSAGLLTYIAGDKYNDYYYVPGYGQRQFTGETRNIYYDHATEKWVAMWDQSKKEGVGILTTKGFPPESIRSYDWWGICLCGEGLQFGPINVELDPGETSTIYNVYLYFFTGVGHEMVKAFYDSVNLTSVPEEPEQQPPPGLEGKIAFMSDRDGNFEIYVINADGTGLIRLTNDPASDGSPSWSPDGRRIAFVSDRDGNSDIYVMNANGTGQVSLTDNPANDWDPSWSPDGRRITFVSDRDGNSDIYVMDADGTGLTRLTNDPAWDCCPSWSPDGQRIAFASTRDDGGWDIYLMNTDGTSVVRLTDAPLNDWDPSWSPDGRRIAFVSDRDGAPEIYVMNADGTGLVRLTNDRDADRHPCWAPDGRRIVFTSNRDGNNEIYVMNADGTGLARLTYDPAGDWQPSWSPYLKIPEAAELIIKDLSTDKAQYYANEPITFRFTVRNQGASPITFKPGIKIVDANGVTTAFTSRKDYTLEADREVMIEHVQAPMARPWTEGVTRWQVLLIGPPPHYKERYAETDFVGEFLVVPSAAGEINARITSLDIAPARVQIGDTLAIRFTVENTGGRDWSFLVDCTIYGPGGYVSKLQQTLSVPRGQVSPPSTFDWPVPADAPAGTYDVELRVYQEATALDWQETAACFMVDKEYSYVETREFTVPWGKRVAIHTHHAPGDIPGSLLLLNVLQNLKLLVSLYGAGSGGVLQTISAAVDTYGAVAPHLLAETAKDGSLDLLFLQLEDSFNTGFLYNGVSFLDVGGKLIPPATVTAIPMQDIPVPGYWRLAAGTPVVGTPLEQLAQMYAPILYLHPDEIYVPDPVELMLDHASLREGYVGMEILPRGAVTAKTFDTKNRPYYYLDLQPALRSLQARGEIRGCAGSPPYEALYQKIRTQDHSVAYARAVQGPDWLVIQYWLFYFYNDWCNKHEGDWELVEVVFENVSTAEQVLASRIEPAFVAYSHHRGGERVPWSRAIWVKGGSAKRPLVFVARGSHANYPSPGWRWWDEVEMGWRVDPKLLPIPQTEDGGLLPEGKWAKFIGRWGESGAGLSHAPRGLLAREQWKDPYGWAMKLPESDPTEDARALWAWVGSPVELHVYDAQGRHVGPNPAGDIDLEIPGAEYEADLEAGRSLVKIPHFESKQGYRIVLKGTGAGTADLVVAIPDAAGKRQQVMQFTDLSVQPALQAELEVTAELDSPLKVDADGDGVFEVQREADATQEITLEVEATKPDGYSWLLVPFLLSATALLLILIAIRTFSSRKGAAEPSSVRCPNCGNVSRPGAKFCMHCGAQLPSARG